MALIRQADRSSVTREAVVLQLGDIKAQGDLLAKIAKESAEHVVSQAKLERERLISDAAAKGHAEGLAQGRTDGTTKGLGEGRQQALVEFRDKLATLDKNWTGALGEFASQREMLVSDAKQDVVRLALAIAEKVIRRSILTSPETVVGMVEGVLASASRRTKMRVRIHPEDESIVRDALPNLAQKLGAAAEHIELVRDGTLSRGSVVAMPADDARSEIDATIETQLARIAEALVPGGVPVSKVGGLAA